MPYCDNCSNTVSKEAIKTTKTGACIKCGKQVKKVKHLSKSEKLAAEHWDFIYSTIEAHTGMEKGSKDYITCKHHYITAFIHGFKHGEER
jgi:hypothetical protein